MTPATLDFLRHDAPLGLYAVIDEQDQPLRREHPRLFNVTTNTLDSYTTSHLLARVREAPVSGYYCEQERRADGRWLILSWAPS